jgi:plasmid replication initiation protein
MPGRNPIQRFGTRVTAEEFVLVVAAADDPAARRKLRRTRCYRGVDIIDGPDVLDAQRQFVETHPEPGEMVVRIMKARHNGRSAEVDPAPRPQIPRIVAQGNNPPVMDCERVDRGEVAARQKARSDVNRVDQHW